MEGNKDLKQNKPEENNTGNKQRQARRGGPGMGGHGMGIVEKPKDFKGTLNKLIEYLKPSLPALIVVIILSIGSVVFAIFGPKIMGQAVTKIFEGLIGKVSGKDGAFDFDGIRSILTFLVVLYGISSFLSFLQGLIVTRVAQKLAFNLRSDLSAKINKLPLKFFDTKTHGEVLSRIVNDVDSVTMTLNQSLSQIISSVTTIIGVLIMMLSISPRMTVAALAILPISMGIVMFIVSRSQKYFKENSALVGVVNSHVEEAFSGFSILKAFNGEEEFKAEYSKINSSLYTSSWKSQFISSIMMPMMGFIGNLGYVFVSILGGYYAIKKVIQVGDIVSFIQYIRNFTQPMAQVAQISGTLQTTMASAERIFEILDEPEEVTEGTKVINPDDVKGRVTFKNVRFGYDPEKVIIKNFSADILPGMRVALVGPTGAGKTTLVKLLMRFYELDGGSIEIDGTDIKEYTRDSLRNLFGMVLQDTWLFNGTIKENILYGDLNKSDEEIIAASTAARAHHFIMTQPKGYDMEINEEANNLSQGQKQLLTIARSIMSDPKIMILDEATSSVDTRTEHLITQAMEETMKSKTSFIIAHRLSTIVDADLILVLNDGDIVEQGTHEDLMAKNGFYADLYSSQFDLV